MSKKFFIFPIFEIMMGSLIWLRKFGAFGTLDEPRYFEAGQSVPWWIECRWPLNIKVKFGRDVETYYKDKYQVVRPNDDGDAPLTTIDGDGHNYVYICGAPTLFVSTPRRRRSVRVPVRLNFSAEAL